MKFALNYSPAAAKFLAQGVIRLDLFKTTDWPEMIADAQRHTRTYIHFSLDAGPGKPVNLDAVEKIRAETSTQFVNVHLAARRSDFPVDDEPKILAQTLVDLRPILARFGPEDVIVENLIFTGPGSEYLRPAVEPNFIQHVIRETSAGFLLDLSHARIAAHYMNVDPRIYIESLPVNHLRELHITGLAIHNNILTDHMAMTDEDWHFAEWAFDRIRAGEWRTPAIVTFEYGGVGKPFEWRTDPAVLASQVPRLYDMVHSK